MAELHYAFIKDNRVVNVAVFASEDKELADRIVEEHGHDKAVWVGENPPAKWSSYDGKKFTAPTPEYLVSIGVLPPQALDTE